MKLKTIWSLRSMSMGERLARSVDWLYFEIASKLPKRIRYWTAMQAIGKATNTGPYATSDVMTTPLDEILKHLEGGPK